MRSDRLIAWATLLVLLACTPPPVAPQPHDSWVELAKGQIELDITDGTDVALAPGTHLGVTAAKARGEVARVELRQGHVHVSNVDHVHHDVMHLQIAGHVLELTRASVLVSHSDGTPHVTFLSGNEVSVSGHPATITGHGERLHLSADGQHSVSRPDRAELQRQANHVGLANETHAILRTPVGVKP